MTPEEEIKKVIKSLGREPLNPIGKCFDSSIICLLNPEINNAVKNLKDIKLCHGIGRSNFLNLRRSKMAHAWLEYTEKNNMRVAICTTWGFRVPVKEYRKQLKLNYVVEYTPDEALKKWMESNPPWDKKIRKIAKKANIMHINLLTKSKNYEN